MGDQTEQGIGKLDNLEKDGVDGGVRFFGTSRCCGLPLDATGFVLIELWSSECFVLSGERGIKWNNTDATGLDLLF